MALHSTDRTAGEACGGEVARASGRRRTSLSQPLAIVRSALGDLDMWFGSLLALETPSYTDDPNVLRTGQGVFSAAEWGVTRRKGADVFGTDGTQYDTDQKYLRHVFGTESTNVIGAILLAKLFDFQRYKSILEIGCGDMAQAFVIHHLHPNIAYTATDLDSYIIERCSTLKLLDGIEKRVLDIAASGDEVALDRFDLLMSWGVDYALDDDQFIGLLRMIRHANVPYLMCSATALGPVKYVAHWLTQKNKSRLLEEGKLRVQGRNRSARRFQRLAQAAGVKARVLGRFGYFFALLFEPDLPERV